VLVPGSRKRILQRRFSRHPWRGIEPGATLRAGGIKLRITHVETIGRMTIVRTRAVRQRKRRSPSNVVPMPRAAGTPLTDFLRYHVLVRVFDGDVDAWIAQLDDEGDMRFARRVRTRLRRDPSFLAMIRLMVDATPLPRLLIGSQ